jgi:hypothetical protein
MRTKKCDECINFLVYQDGDGYHEPYTEELECKYMSSNNTATLEMLETNFDSYIEDASGCCLYDPGFCQECGAKNREVHDVSGMWDVKSCCSKQCACILQHKLNKEMKEMIFP